MVCWQFWPARASCSASYKDVLARTVTKGARGTVSGTAGSVAAVAVFAFALIVSLGIIPLKPVAIALAVALLLDEPADDKAEGLSTAFL